jgi:hypothetical protein
MLFFCTCVAEDCVSWVDAQEAELQHARLQEAFTRALQPGI